MKKPGRYQFSEVGSHRAYAWGAGGGWHLSISPTPLRWHLSVLPTPLAQLPLRGQARRKESYCFAVRRDERRSPATTFHLSRER